MYPSELACRFGAAKPAVTGLLLAAALACGADPAGAGVLKGESLISPVPTGFRAAAHGENGPVATYEFVPAGETAADWSKMVTVQIMHNLKGTAPDAFAGNLRTRWLAACAGGDAKKINAGVENGYPISLWLFSCPLNPKTSKPENMFTKIIGGTDSLYSIQFAYRSGLTKEVIPPTMQYLKSVQACDTRLADKACPSGM